MHRHYLCELLERSWEEDSAPCPHLDRWTREWFSRHDPRHPRVGDETIHRRGQSGLGLQQYGQFKDMLKSTNTRSHILKPVFWIRDPLKFPSLNRSHKRHPQTHLTDPNMVRDMDSTLVHESCKANMLLVLGVSSHPPQTIPPDLIDLLQLSCRQPGRYPPVTASV